MNSTIILLKKKNKKKTKKIKQQKPITLVWHKCFIFQGTEAAPKTEVQIPYK